MLYFCNEYWRTMPKISIFYGMKGAFPTLFRQKKGSFLYISPIIEKRGSFLYLLTSKKGVYPGSLPIHLFPPGALPKDWLHRHVLDFYGLSNRECFFRLLADFSLSEVIF